jgi:hypothetical protein
MHQSIYIKKLRTYLIRTAASAAVVISLAGPAAAQREEEGWTGNIGAGFTSLVGSMNTRLDNGWNISFGAGYHLTSRFTFGVQAMYNGLSVNSNVLREFAVPDANARIWAITAEPRLTFARRYKFQPYIVGGVGYYRRVVEFTFPTFRAVTIFDPFFFASNPASIRANFLFGRFIRDGIGGNAGAGFQFPIGQTGFKIFAEARFHYAGDGSIPTRMVPFTVGLRY